jgi:hypothetical protein
MNLNADIDLEAWASRPFTSPAFRAEAYADRRYKTDAHYRDCIGRKEMISNIGIAPVVHNNLQSIEIVNGGIGTRGTEAGEQLASELKAVDEEMIEKHGAQSIKPAPVEKPKEPSAQERSTFFSKAIDSGDSPGISVRVYPAF